MVSLNSRVVVCSSYTLALLPVFIFVLGFMCLTSDHGWVFFFFLVIFLYSRSRNTAYLYLYFFHSFLLINSICPLYSGSFKHSEVRYLLMILFIQARPRAAIVWGRGCLLPFSRELSVGLVILMKGFSKYISSLRIPCIIF